MDRIEYKICNTQKRIYIYAAKLGYEPEHFSNAFLESEFCSEAFDTDYSRFQFEFPNECMDFILPEIETKLIRADNIDADLAGYVGFIYRYLYYVTSYSSRELVKKVPYKAIEKTASTAMIEDEAIAVEKICIENGLEYMQSKLSLRF